LIRQKPNKLVKRSCCQTKIGVCWYRDNQNRYEDIAEVFIFDRPDIPEPKQRNEPIIAGILIVRKKMQNVMSK
jgi:hypothetical protein